MSTGRPGERAVDTSAESGPSRVRRRFLVPERIQSSPMDCGPAALWSLLEGHRIDVSYASLREACLTGIDGTSISELQRVARALGLDARQVLVPPDQVGHEAADYLPAVAVTREAGGTMHFVLLWRRIGRWVQVMDPGSGRRWMRLETLRRRLYSHSEPMEASRWRSFAGSPASRAVWRKSLEQLGHRDPDALLAEALEQPGWRPIAMLEAALRMVQQLVDRRALGRGRAAARFVETVFRSTQSGGSESSDVPAPWAHASVQSHAPDPVGRAQLRVRGALLVRVRGHCEPDPGTLDRPAKEALAQVLKTRRRPVWRTVWELSGAAQRHLALWIAGAGALAAGTVVVQALLFRALLGVGPVLGLEGQRMAALLAVFVFLAAASLIELPLAAGQMRLGRAIEARLKAAFQARLVRLPQRWFGSRPISDMAERAHGLDQVGSFPTLAIGALRALFLLAFTALGLVLLDPGGAGWVILAAATCVAVPLVGARTLVERDLLVQSHHGALTRFYLEALLGRVAVRVHGAGPALRREHESLLVEWSRAALVFARAAVGVQALGGLVQTGFAIGLVSSHLARVGVSPAALLYGYWALMLPAIADQLANAVATLPGVRNAAQRALEPLEEAPASASPGLAPAGAGTGPAVADAPEVALGELRAAGSVAPAPVGVRSFGGLEQLSEQGRAIRLREVELSLGGHPVLQGLSLDVQPGQHVAIVGRSGAGKSSLIALLLGLEVPSRGELQIDGRAVGAGEWTALRQSAAWVDPGVQLWNSSAFDNLVYGLGHTDEGSLARALADADATDLIENLPRGLATSLGESGSGISGGEGQRLRLARALLRSGVRLALLDEPFRGVDRATRARLLENVRRRWRGATLLCVTHDLEQARGFDAVVVLEQGRLLECGPPGVLLERTESAFSQLLEAERRLHAERWQSERWSHWRLEGGRLKVARRDSND